MSQVNLVEMLAKANRDVKKLCEFFAARRNWTLAHFADVSGKNLAAATTKIDERLKGLIAKSGSQPDPPAKPDVELLPAGVFDDGRLSRMTDFLRDLDTWFAAQDLATGSREVLSELKEMQARLACIAGLIRTVSATADAQAPSEPATDGGVRATAAGDASGGSSPTVPEGVPRQLVLDDTDETPMIQDFQGITELTDECKQAVDGFLAAWGLETSYIKRKKLLERLLRWISSAPEGHVLVMKMKTAEAPFEPYPSYISREVLAGKPLDEELEP